MDTAQILFELRAERDRINAAIAALEALGGSGFSPAKTAKPTAASVTPTQSSTTGRRTMSPAARRKIAAAQRARWAAQKKPTKPTASIKQVATKKAAAKTATKKSSKGGMTAAGRKRLSEALKARWAAKKAAAAKA